MLSDLCMILAFKFYVFFEIWQTQQYLIGKSHDLGDSGLTSYVFYCSDVKQKANGLRGGDAYPSQVRSLPTKVEAEKVVRKSQHFYCIVFFPKYAPKHRGSYLA